MPRRETHSTVELPPSHPLTRAVRDHHAMVFRVAYGVLGHRADAEDVAQSTFLALVRHRAALREPASLGAWLAKVAVNEARQLVRGETRRRRRQAEWLNRRPTEQRSTEEETHMTSTEGVNDAVDGLPEELRLPLVLHYAEGLKYREIAEVLGCPEGTVAKRLHTGRRRLEQELATHRVAAVGGVSVAGAIDHWLPPTPVGLEAKLTSAVASAAATSGATLFGVGVSSRLGWSSLSAVAIVAATLVVILGFNGGDPVPVSATTAAASDPVPTDTPADEPPVAKPKQFPPAVEEAIDRLITGRKPEAIIDGPRVVHGRVIDEEAEPVAGARVELVLTEDGRVVRREQLTDAEGYYRFEDVPADLGPTPSSTGLGSPPMTGTSGGVDWAKHKPPFLGQTAMFGGMGLTVRVFADGFRSSSDGNYAISNAALDLEKNYTLRGATRVHGAVRDGDGQPVAGATVRVLGGAGSSSGLDPHRARSPVFARFENEDVRTVTDARGRFEFTRLGEARYLLEASAPGYGAHERLVSPGPDAAEFTLPLAGRVEVLVEHRGAGQPIANARVGVFVDGYQRELTTTDASGRVHFNLEPGRYAIAVFRNALPVHTEVIQVAAGATEERRVRVDDFISLIATTPQTPREYGATLRAHLRPIDSAAERAGVGERPHSMSLAWRAHTAIQFVPADGVMTFEGLVPGRYLLEVFGTEMKGAIAYKLISRVVELGPAPNVVSIDLEDRPIPHGRIELSLRSVDGEPVAKAMAHVVGAEAEYGYSWVRSDAAGEVDLVVPSGRYRLRIDAPGYQTRYLDAFDLRGDEVRPFAVTLESRADEVAALEAAFPPGRAVWVAAGARYRALRDLIADTATIPVRSSRAIDSILRQRRIDWATSRDTSAVVRESLSYLGLDWSIRDGVLWIVPR